MNHLLVLIRQLNRMNFLQKKILVSIKYYVNKNKKGYIISPKGIWYSLIFFDSYYLKISSVNPDKDLYAPTLVLRYESKLLPPKINPRVDLRRLVIIDTDAGSVSLIEV